MFSTRIYIRILLHVTGIVAVTLLAVAGIVSGKAVILGCLCAAAVPVQVAGLAAWLNASNRRIQLFLDAVSDNESSLHFPEEQGSEEQRRLYAAFNRITRLLSEARVTNSRQEQFYRTLLQHIPGGVISWGEDGDIRLANDKALRLLGCSFLRTIHQAGQRIPGFAAALQEAAASGATLLQVNHGATVRQLSLSLSRIRAGGEEITTLILQDIGRELGQKEFESWDKLTHVLTHEIMNSIAPIVSLSGTLLSYYQPKNPTGEHGEITGTTIHKTIRGLETIRSQGQGLLHFTDSFRSLSFLPAPKPTSFALQQLIQNVALLFQADFERLHIRLVIELPQSGIRLNADEELLSQVLVNLLKNAMQALDGQTDKRISIRAYGQEGTVIEVTDNGSGIPPEIMDNLFVPFFTTKSGGCGIGLSLSRQIIRMHGGDLQAASLPENTTRFTITLPEGQHPRTSGGATASPGMGSSDPGQAADKRRSDIN